MRRIFLQNLLLALFGVSLALGMALVVLRLTGIRLTAPVPDNTFTPCVPAAGDWLDVVRAVVSDYREPCLRFYWLDDPQGEYHHQIVLNNYGLHDTDFTLEKPAGAYRVLVLGDSFVQGWQVTRLQGFPALVETALNARDGTPPVEVLNMGVDAYGTDRELLLYAALGDRFQPDTVLLVMYIGNDVQDNQIDLEARRYGYRLNRPYFSLDATDNLVVHHLPTVASELLPEGMAGRWLAGLSAQPSLDAEARPPEHPAVLSTEPYTLEYPVELGVFLPEDAHWSDAWRLTEALVVQLRDLVVADGRRFAVAIIPDRRTVHAEDWAATIQAYRQSEGADPLMPGTRLATLLSAQGIPVLNLTNSLKASATATGERLYYPVDGHFNAAGHAVTAQRLGVWLHTEGLVP